MGVKGATLAGTIRERTMGRPPRRWMSLPYGFRLELAASSDQIELYNIHQPSERVSLGTASRDNWGPRWFLRFGWRAEVSRLLAQLDIEDDSIEEIITW
jgi:hypothetical protein